MATVPGVLIIGGYHVQGGEPGLLTQVDALNGDNLRYTLDREVQRFVPDAADGTPNAASLGFWPWYDGAASLTDYTIANSTTTTITATGSPGWTVNQWVGRAVQVRNLVPIPGVGFASRSVITANTANTVTFTPALGTPPAVGASFMLGQGVFLDYHPSGGKLHPSELGQQSRRGGSSWQTLGLGVGPDATLLRRLWKDIYTTWPYFACFKYGNISTVNTGWADSPNDSARALFLAEMVRVNAAAAARGNTIAWDVVVIDQSMADLVAAAGNPVLVFTYEARLREMIAWLKATVTANADLKVVLVSHRGDMWSTTAPGGAPFFRAAHRAIARDTAGVTIVDMEGATPALQINSPETPANEVKYYSLADVFDYGEKVAKAIQQAKLGVPQAATGGFPVYYLIGDSIVLGEANALWTANSVSIDISGPTPGSLLRPSNQLIWNDGTSTFEVYEPHANSNTSGTIRDSAGPDLSILAELGRIHPEGFGVIKRGSGGSGLASSLVAYGGGNNGRWRKSAGEHYTALLNMRDRAHQYVNNVLGKQVDCKGFFVSLGHNDQAVANGGALFAAELAQFCEDLWADFATRTSGNRPPIAWRRPQADAAGAVAAQMDLVRSAIEDYADSEAQFRIVDVDGLERRRDDNLHETPETAVVHGRRAVAQIARVAI